LTSIVLKNQNVPPIAEAGVEQTIDIEASLDKDYDGLTRGWELVLGTDPDNPDTDGDGIIDAGDPDILANNLPPKSAF